LYKDQQRYERIIQKFVEAGAKTFNMDHKSENLSVSLPASLSMADLEFLITSKSSPNVTVSNYNSRTTSHNLSSSRNPPPELQQILELYAEQKHKFEEIKQNLSVESKIKDICYDMMINVLESTGTVSGHKLDSAKQLAKVLQKTKHDDFYDMQSPKSSI